ncbi:MAG: amidohydrolase family protein [Terriglobia bacterium]
MILSSPWVIPISGPPIADGAIAIEGEQIVAVGPKPLVYQHYPQFPPIEFPACVLMPGFVNVHSHLELSILRGYLEDLTFWKWIRELTRIKYEVLSYDDLVVSAFLGAFEAVRAGITTVADPMDVGGTLQAVLGTGIRGLVYQEVFSPKADEAEAMIHKLDNQLRLCRSRIDEFPGNSAYHRFFKEGLNRDEKSMEAGKKRLRLGVSPHAPYTVSAPLFRAAHRYAKDAGLAVCIHAGESAAEWEFLQQGTGVIADSYQARQIPWLPPHTTPLNYLHNLGVVDENTLLVHCIHLEAGDFNLLETQNAAVAHCPKSNSKLGHGYMNLREVYGRKIRLGLGTDSVASNNAMDMFEEMRFARGNPSMMEGQNGTFNLSTPLSAESLLRMATLGGAETLGMSKEIGSLEVGKAADIIAVDLSGLHVQPVFSPVDALVYSCRAPDVRMTMVAGEILFHEEERKHIYSDAFSERVETIRRKMLHARRES